MTKNFLQKKTFFEFFAGGGMARLGLGDGWTCLFANDFDSQKAAAYDENFGGADFVEADIASLSGNDLPEAAPDLVWSSFPCQDLSLAGGRGGLAGARSGVFHAFWALMETLQKTGRAPKCLVLENVAGLISSNRGEDFQKIITLIARAGYTVSALMIDARHFTPQSRRRIFIFGFRSDMAPPAGAAPKSADDETPDALLRAVAQLPAPVRNAWRWLSPRPAPARNMALVDMIDAHAVGWRSRTQTQALLKAMSPAQHDIVNQLQASGARHVGAAYKRIRMEQGKKVLRVEARFDGLAGCLRTPAGGSSRQLIFDIDKGRVRTRLLNPREAARLMGLPEEYRLPKTATAALKLCGDGVCVPVVRWIAENILEPALAENAAAA